jgi:wyosine [tRNA(Phe)-imidazoG37] synthetase (radical SAM superfamily)
MERLKSREHDFSSKLRQKSVVQRLKEYISWQRNLKGDATSQRLPNVGPVSINLDLTSACNFLCSHCVDSMIINTGEYLKLEEIKETINVLHSNGLLSVILVGGGEPTLHKDFGEVARYIKGKGLEIGIVTNGSRLDKIAEIADRLREKDWIRISIDAAKKETFKKLHHPRTEVSLDRILKEAKKIKEINPVVSLGYSFVIVWEGIENNGKKLTPNIGEMAESVVLAREHAFDYVSFKPCLIRLKESKRESLLDQVDKDKEDEIVKEIVMNLQKAKDVAGNTIRILESVNLKAMLNKETERIKQQPRRCHMQFFRTVVTPTGIFHCPAFRGIENAKIAESDGYLTKAKLKESLKSTATSILAFDAEKECKVVGCFYNQTNWWLEDFICSEMDISEIEKIEDNNFFL